MIFPRYLWCCNQRIKEYGEIEENKYGKKKCIDETFTNIIGGKENNTFDSKMG